METVVALLVIGAALLLLETVLPGMIAGLLGILCLIIGVGMGYANFGVRTGNTILLGVSAGLILGALAWLKYFPDSRMARVFVSQKRIGELGVEKPDLLDKSGVALTTLRPSGAALIDGKRVDVITEGALIERGTAIRVVAVEGMKVVVRIAAADPPTSNQT